MYRYTSHEFCEAVQCEGLSHSLNGTPQCGRADRCCLKTAKEFHKWLEQNLFIIEAPENEYEASNL